MSRATIGTVHQRHAVSRRTSPGAAPRWRSGRPRSQSLQLDTSVSPGLDAAWRQRRSTPALLALLLLAAPLIALRAQHVQVALTGTGGAPLQGAIVSLERPGDSTRHAPALTDARGNVLVRAPVAGRWRVRADMVGAETWRSRWLELATGDTTALRAEITSRRIMLPAVVVEERTRCQVRPAQAGTVTAIWQEARKAVLASMLVADARAPTLRVRRFTRLLTPFGTMRRESADTLLSTTTRPFVTARSAAELARLGYVMERGGDRLYLAPDAEVLLSDEFAGGHCFSLAEDREHPELVGLAFHPTIGRDLPEIAGVFWLDRASSELRTLEYRYVNVGELAEGAHAGGRVEFRRLPDGLWLVSAWHIRTPRAGVVRQRLPGGRMAQRDTLFGSTEEGATVLAVQPRRALPIADAVGPATVVGAVYDSVARRPLVGARVHALTTTASTLTDAHGEYRLRLPAGPITLQVAHPRLALYRVPVNRDIDASGGGEYRADVAIGAGASLRARLCPADPDDAPQNPAMVVGTLTSAADGRPIRYAALRAIWYTQEVEAGTTTIRTTQVPVSRMASTDSAGTFLFCDLPPRVPVDIVAEAPEFAPVTVRVRLGPSAVTEHSLRLVPCPPDGDDHACAPESGVEALRLSAGVAGMRSAGREELPRRNRGSGG